MGEIFKELQGSWPRASTSLYTPQSGVDTAYSVRFLRFPWEGKSCQCKTDQNYPRLTVDDIKYITVKHDSTEQ